MSFTGFIFWDFEGTLTKSQPLWHRAVLAQLDTLVPAHRLSIENLVDPLSELFFWNTPLKPHPEVVGSLQWWDHHNRLLQDVLDELGVEEDLAHKAVEGIRDYILDGGNYSVKGNAPRVLGELQEKGWKHLLVSNHVPELDQIIQSTNLAPFFESCISSGVVGFEKPLPQIFAAALEKCGQPDRVRWMVGDNPINDMDGARRAGIPGILLGDNSVPHQFKARNLLEVYDLINQS